MRMNRIAFSAFAKSVSPMVAIAPIESCAGRMVVVALACAILGCSKTGEPSAPHSEMSAPAEINYSETQFASMSAEARSFAPCDTREADLVGRVWRLTAYGQSGEPHFGENSCYSMTNPRLHLTGSLTFNPDRSYSITLDSIRSFDSLILQASCIDESCQGFGYNCEDSDEFCHCGPSEFAHHIFQSGQFQLVGQTLNLLPIDSTWYGPEIASEDTALNLQSLSLCVSGNELRILNINGDYYKFRI